MKSYPTEYVIEADDESIIVKIETFDQCTVAIKIDTVFSIKSWREASRIIAECLPKMIDEQ